MDRACINLFRTVLENKDRLPSYINELYTGDEYSSSDLNEIFGVLKSEGLITGLYADNRFQECMITFKGKHYFDDQDINATNSSKDKEDDKKKPMLFISHASENKTEAEFLIGLLKRIGLTTKDQIFCSTSPGYDVPMYKGMFEYLKSCFTDTEVHVIFLLSEAYYNSAYCLNEMGAAWVMQSKYTAILLPGFHKEQMDGFLKDKEPAIQLDSNYNEIRNKLDQFRDLLIKDFSLKPVDEDEWSLACRSFFENMRLKNIPYKKPSKQLAQQIVIGEYAENLIKKCVSENEDIILSANLSQGHSIQIGKDIVAAELPDKRNFARCEAAIDECLEAGFLKRNHCGYSLTDAGYRYVENVQECVK